MRADPTVIVPVARARDGDQRAWNEIVDRYAPLVWSIRDRYQLSRHDIDDVGQTVWLPLVQQHGNLRQPAAKPGWLAISTQRECFRALRAARRYDCFGSPVDIQMSQDQPALLKDPPRSYAEISVTLPIPIGSIGPQHARCLGRLRHSRALAALSGSDIKNSEVNGASANETEGARRA
jgi:hypothetical protein